MIGYVLLKNNNELISMFTNESSALYQLGELKENRTNPDKYTVKKINIGGNCIDNNSVYSIFKQEKDNSVFKGCYCFRKDAEKRIQSLDKDLIYMDVYYIEEHPIFD